MYLKYFTIICRGAGGVGVGDVAIRSFVTLDNGVLITALSLSLSVCVCVYTGKKCISDMKSAAGNISLVVTLIEKQSISYLC